jgi:hypothetical protein
MYLLSWIYTRSRLASIFSYLPLTTLFITDSPPRTVNARHTVPCFDVRLLKSFRSTGKLWEVRWLWILDQAPLRIWKTGTDHAAQCPQSKRSLSAFPTWVSAMNFPFA